MPATQQHLDFLVAPDGRRQSGFVLCLETAFHFGRAQNLPGRYWLRPSLKRDRAEIAAFEMPIGEVVRTLGNQYRPGIGERLQARSQVRRLADDRLLLRRAFAGQVSHHHHAGRDANANLQLGGGVCPEPGHGIDQRQPGACRLFGIILVRLGVAEIGEHAISHVPRDNALILGNNPCDAAVIGAHHGPQVLQIEAGRKCRRADQIAKHDCKLTPPGVVRRRRPGAGSRCSRQLSLKVCDRAQHLAAMPKQDAQVLEILLREISNDREVDGVFAESARRTRPNRSMLATLRYLSWHTCGLTRRE